MKYTLVFIIWILLSGQLFAQKEEVISPSNGTVTSLEKNLLFYAQRKLKVTQSGSIQLPLQSLFDGSMNVVYSAQGINPSNPYVLLIENMPNFHTQRGAWIGWSTRYYEPKKFKIEVYDQLTGQWSTVSDVNNHANGYFITSAPAMSIGKIRFTVFETVQGQNILGLSEFFYIHPEAAQAYDDLLVKYNENGFVGIGTNTPQETLSVNGNIRAHQIKVETSNWPDYVFKDDYQLPSLEETEKFIQTNGHLPDVPKAEVIHKEGYSLNEMDKILLKKIEEMTLYMIDKDKRIQALEETIKKLNIK